MGMIAQFVIRKEIMINMSSVEQVFDQSIKVIAHNVLYMVKLNNVGMKKNK